MKKNQLFIAVGQSEIASGGEEAVSPLCLAGGGNVSHGFQDNATTGSVKRITAFFSVLTVLVLLCSFSSFAQDTVKGKLEVIKDPRIDSLALHRLDLNKSHGESSSATTAFGYRVQIFSGSNRKEAFDTQSRFQERYPDVHTYITYREPNFKVRAGDFRSRLEATKLMEELKAEFSGMFIISETINLPKPETTDE